MTKSKLKELVMQCIQEEIAEGKNPPTTMFLKTDSKSNRVLYLWSGVPTQVRKLKPNAIFTDSDEIDTILNNLDEEELNRLMRKSLLSTTNIPAEIVNLTGRNIPKD